MKAWMSDVAVGVRLAVGGGRTTLARFALSAFGIAIAVAVLLVAASIGTMNKERDARTNAASVSVDPVPGVNPVYYKQNPTEFRGQPIDVSYVYADGRNNPVPAGMRALPRPGELVASPALVDLLNSPDGRLLRPRFPDRLIGVMDQSMVRAPGDLMAYVGADKSFTDSPDAQPVYAFGTSRAPNPTPPELLLLVLVGSVALLLPVFIFVGAASRIAGAERDRRLSALRLVGAGSRQVRRIAAAESLVSALAGLVLGGAVFLGLRHYAGYVRLFDLQVYPSDVTPDPRLVVPIVLAVPALAVLTAQFALRRTVIEPLGVVRRAKPVRRRLWWRLAMVVLGVVLLFTHGGAAKGTDRWAYAVAAGAALLLVGVPILLPWLVERVAGRLRGGPASWQLAIRRLQLDSGTSARVVGGIAVVLAGAIALQTVLTTVAADLGLSRQPVAQQSPTVMVDADGTVADAAAARLRTAPAVRGAYVVRDLVGYRPGASEDSTSNRYISVLDCAGVRARLGVRDCTDGQIFSWADPSQSLTPGQSLEFREYPSQRQPQARVDPSKYEKVGSWTVPNTVVTVRPPRDENMLASVVVTPGALGKPVPGLHTTVLVPVAHPNSDQLEQIRNAVARFGWRVYVFSFDTTQDLTIQQATFVSMRNAVYAGSVFTLMLAGVSLMVLALEHIRERRRPLAVLAASGVQRGVLARSLLWQVVLPIGLGVVVALLTGVGLAWLIVRLSEDALSIDWAGAGLLSAGAAMLALLVTAMTLPFLRGATRLTSLRTE